MIQIDFAPVRQQEADIFICALAFGRVYGSRSMALPSGDMAQDAFDQMLDEAWDRLTPKQQAAVLGGGFRVTVPTYREVLPDGSVGEPIE